MNFYTFCKKYSTTIITISEFDIQEKCLSERIYPPFSDQEIIVQKLTFREH